MNLWGAAHAALGELLQAIDRGYAAVPLVRAWSWGAAVVTLTLLARLALVPTTVLQVRFARAMASVRPQLEEIRERNRADVRLLASDPKQYGGRWLAKEDEESRVLKDNGIRWWVGFLPALVQIPVLVAVLRLYADRQEMAELTPATLGFAADPVASVLHSGRNRAALLVVVAVLGLLVHLAQQQRVRGGPEPVSARMRPVRLYLFPLATVLLALNLGLAILVSLGTSVLWGIGQHALTARRHTPAEPVPA